MAFSISGFVSDSNDDVVSVDWQYTTADGSLGNTAAEFDAALVSRKSRSDYEAGFVSYSRESDNTYSVVPSDSV